MCRVLGNLPIEVKGASVEVGEKASEEAIIEGMARVLAAGTELTVSSRFCLGDLYNQLDKRYGVKADKITSTFGRKYYNLLRQYGWISGKWPVEMRDTSLAWTFYRDGTPDNPAPDKPSPSEKAKAKAKEMILMWSRGRWSRDRFDEFYDLFTNRDSLPIPQEEKPVVYAHKSGYGADAIHEETP